MRRRKPQPSPSGKGIGDVYTAIVAAGAILQGIDAATNLYTKARSRFVKSGVAKPEPRKPKATATRTKATATRTKATTTRTKATTTRSKAKAQRATLRAARGPRLGS